MKRLLLAVLVVAGLASSAFATDANKVSTRVQNSFAEKFVNAQNVQWTAKENFNKVSFTLADEQVEAFFAIDGDLLGYSRKVDFKSLPLAGIQKIKKEYAGYTIRETIEFQQNDEKAFYVSLEKDGKKQVLEVSLYGSVSIFKGSGK
jgi:opacity protein-like surface antigen